MITSSTRGGDAASWPLVEEAKNLVARAAAQGYDLLIQRVAQQPLAMGNYAVQVSVWPNRAVLQRRENDGIEMDAAAARGWADQAAAERDAGEQV